MTIHRKVGRTRLFAGCALGALLATTTLQPAVAQVGNTFTIPSEDLGTALRAFATQSGRDVVFDPAVVCNKTAPAVSGQLASEDALRHILLGSGLNYTVTASGSFVIQSPPKNAEAASNEAAFPANSDVETVTVTGTHIRGVTDQYSPVTAYSRDDMDAQGYATVGDALRALPQNFSGGASILTEGAGSEAGVGAQGVNLRGLGNQATLVLLDGHRMAPSGLNGNFIDLAAIPTSAIDRVEVLTDGASAIYGADAIAGVVNILLRNDFDGFETRARVGSTTDGGAGDVQLAQTIGQVWDGGHAMLSYEHDNQGGLHSDQRDWSSSMLPANDLTPGTTRNSLFGTAGLDLTETTGVSAEGYFNQRTSKEGLDEGGYYSYQVSHDQSWGGTVSAHTALFGDWTADLAGTAGLNQYNAPTYHDLPHMTGITDRTQESVFDVEASAGGSLFDLPGGAVRLALGAQGRWDSFKGGTITLPPGTVYSYADRDRSVAAAYAEAFFPLVSPDNDISGIYRLSLDVAGRFEDYSDVGISTNPKIGILWSPVHDVTFRGTYGTSFRAPDLNTLNNQITITILARYAPTPTAPTQISLLVAGNTTDLKPESSTSWSGGVDYEPSFAPELKLSATYFRVDYADQVTTPTFPHTTSYIYYAGDIPPVFNPSPVLIAQFIAASPFNANVAPPGTTPAQATVLLSERPVNASTSLVDGLDFSAHYAQPTDIGLFNATLDWTYLFHESAQFFPTSPLVENLNTVGNPVALKLKGGISWTKDAWSASFFVNAVGGYHDIDAVGAASDRVAPWTTVDFSASYHLQSGLGIGLPDTVATFAVQNLFDLDPPVIPSANVATNGNELGLPYDSANANPFGRVVSLQLTTHW